MLNIQTSFYNWALTKTVTEAFNYIIQSLLRAKYELIIEIKKWGGDILRRCDFLKKNLAKNIAKFNKNKLSLNTVLKCCKY